jgi:hypothetical protein
MKLEQQVCNLDLAKRLKELGVKQESVFCWATNDLEHKLENYRVKPVNGGFVPDGYISQDFPSAFTVAELGEMMPPERQSFRDGHESVWKMYIHSVISGSVEKVIRENTEADARAKMLIYLIENKLLTV